MVDDRWQQQSQPSLQFQQPANSAINNPSNQQSQNQQFQQSTTSAINRFSMLQSALRRSPRDARSHTDSIAASWHWINLSAIKAFCACNVQLPLGPESGHAKSSASACRIQGQGRNRGMPKVEPLPVRCRQTFFHKCNGIVGNMVEANFNQRTRKKMDKSSSDCAKVRQRPGGVSLSFADEGAPRVGWSKFFLLPQSCQVS